MLEEKIELLMSNIFGFKRFTTAAENQVYLGMRDNWDDEHTALPKWIKWMDGESGSDGLSNIIAIIIIVVDMYGWNNCIF